MSYMHLIESSVAVWSLINRIRGEWSDAYKFFFNQTHSSQIIYKYVVNGWIAIECRSKWTNEISDM